MSAEDLRRIEHEIALAASGFEILKKSSTLKDFTLAAELIRETLNKGNKILIAGNGGSAADAQHIAGEFIVRLFPEERRGALPAIALTTDSSVLTACANDLGFKYIFSRQIEALGTPGDLFWGISTSGSSENILAAFETAKARKMKTLLFKGPKKCPLKVDVCVSVPGNDTPTIQLYHLFFEHMAVKFATSTKAKTPHPPKGSTRR